ncbi:MAG: ankyrin repeat domain-containing protein [Armatimonadota bacterium]
MEAWGGSTPLHVAARCGQTRGAELLLEHGADVTAENNKGVTPLTWRPRMAA